MFVMKQCSKCKINPQRPKARYCLSCHSANMREWRKTHPLNPEQKKKDICRSYTSVLIKRGKITKSPCETIHCEEKAEAHHPDYNNPRLIIWLCRKHHLSLHKELNQNEKSSIKKEKGIENSRD